ncbi:MAG: ATP-dependent RecD-like DNA helicase [Bacilli bacterium]|nr:ATP-dependent RecD-like DNA helicase [Bacilli bacterium]
MKTQLKGSVRHIIYQTDKGFIVGLFKVKNIKGLKKDEYLNRTITFTGIFPESLDKGDYLLVGEFISHPKYGKQFKVENYERLLPDNKDSIITFLASPLFKGIGIRTATKIVEQLGDKALDLIIDDHTCILNVSQMTNKKAQMIQAVLKQEVMSYKIIIELQNLGFTINEASKIYNIYKENTLKQIDTNIYQIMLDVDGISFLTLDKIALNQNIEPESDIRIEACILYHMSQLCFEEGNIYLHCENIFNAVNNYLSFDLANDKFDYHIINLNKKHQIIIENEKYYLRDYYKAETENAFILVNLINKPKKEYNNIDSVIKKWIEQNKIKYNKDQINAIKSSMLNRLLIITGGPGTGKTTIIKAIVDIYLKLYNLDSKEALDQIALLAPTGRAARKMSEVTNFPALTIHRFLKWNKETNEFGVNKNNKADVRFIIIDEVSMIDNYLLYHLLQGLKRNIQIILIGDYHQLPSVGPGQVLLDLIKTNKVPLIELNTLYRQQENSYILNLAYEIKEGQLSNNWLTKQSDFNFIECPRDNIKDIIIKLCQNALEKEFKPEEIQVIAPMYRGLNGIDNLNKALQDVFNPKTNYQNCLVYHDCLYREGDKVLQTKNNIDANVANGDIGIIKYINNKTEKITIDFNGVKVDYNLIDFTDITLGYAISIHKAQGSEFDIIIMPMDMSFSRMLYRKLIYTGVTRAKKSLMLVGQKEAFIRSVDNNYEAKRQTTLKEKIINLYKDE